MTAKYECPECGRRFKEWGAEKLGFKCPVDEFSTDGHPENVELVPIGFEQDQPMRRKPSLKRAATATKRRTTKKIVTEASLLDADIEDDVAEIDEEETEDEEVVEEVIVASEVDVAIAAVVETDEDADDDEVEVTDDVVPFGDAEAIEPEPGAAAPDEW